MDSGHPSRVDMSTTLLPEAVPEIDANPVSLVGGGGTEGLEFGSSSHHTRAVGKEQSIVHPIATPSCLLATRLSTPVMTVK